MKKCTATSLKHSEWIIIFLFSSFFLALSLSTYLKAHRCRSSILKNQLRAASVQNKPGLLTVWVKGEGVIKKGAYFVPLETRVCDLKRKIELTPKANLKIFKSRRKLKMGEEIYVFEKED